MKPDAVPAPGADPVYEPPYCEYACDHGCGRQATVLHADGRELCKLCYLVEARVAPHGGECPTCGRERGAAS